MGLAIAWPALKPLGISLAMVFGCAASVTAACQQQSRNSTITVASLKAELDASLAKGASSNDVEAFLAHKGMTHSGLIDNAELAHMGFDPNTYELKSLVKNTKRTALVNTDISVTFVFDREKKLIDTRVAEVHTGP